MLSARSSATRNRFVLLHCSRFRSYCNALSFLKICLLVLKLILRLECVIQSRIYMEFRIIYGKPSVRRYCKISTTSRLIPVFTVLMFWFMQFHKEIKYKANRYICVSYVSSFRRSISVFLCSLSCEGHYNPSHHRMHIEGSVAISF